MCRGLIRTPVCSCNQTSICPGSAHRASHPVLLFLMADWDNWGEKLRHVRGGKWTEASLLLGTLSINNALWPTTLGQLLACVPGRLDTHPLPLIPLLFSLSGHTNGFKWEPPFCLSHPSQKRTTGSSGQTFLNQSSWSPFIGPCLNNWGFTSLDGS